MKGQGPKREHEREEAESRPVTFRVGENTSTLPDDTYSVIYRLKTLMCHYLSTPRDTQMSGNFQGPYYERSSIQTWTVALSRNNTLWLVRSGRWLLGCRGNHDEHTPSSRVPWRKE